MSEERIIFNCDFLGTPYHSEIYKHFLAKSIEFVNKINFVFNEENISKFPIKEMFSFLKENNFFGFVLILQNGINMTFEYYGDMLEIQYDEAGICFLVEDVGISKEQIEKAIGIKIKQAE